MREKDTLMHNYNKLLDNNSQCYDGNVVAASENSNVQLPHRKFKR